MLAVDHYLNIRNGKKLSVGFSRIFPDEKQVSNKIVHVNLMLQRPSKEKTNEADVGLGTRR